MRAKVISKNFLVKIRVKGKKPVILEVSAADRKAALHKIGKQYWNTSYWVLGIEEK